jgi:hypothetical protein
VPAPPVPANRDRAAIPSPAQSSLTFTDVTEEFWASPYIEALAARGVVSGLPTGRFEPNRPMTRAEFATQIVSAFEMAPRQERQIFTDVAPEYWANATIQEAVQMGFVTGYPNNTFRPTVMVTRLQVLTALATGLSLPTPNAATSWLEPYQDAAAVPDWAENSVAAAIAADIITPSLIGASQLRPNAPATRAEVATLIHRTLVYMGQIDPIEP